MNKKRFGPFTKRTLANLLVVCIGVVLYLALSNLSSVTAVLGQLYAIIAPFVAGLVLAYLLNIPMRFFERRLYGRFRRKRGLAILTTYLLALLLLALLLVLVLPQLAESVMTLAGNLPQYLNNLNSLFDWLGTRFQLDPAIIESFTLTYTDVINALMGIIRDYLPNLPSLGMQIGNVIIGILTAVIASIYMLASKDKLIRQVTRVLYALLPKRGADGIMRVARLANGTFSGFISGKVIDSVIIGAICFIFMSIMNLGVLPMPFAPLISIIIGVTNIIPFFGPFIGAIPSIMILLMVNPWSGLWFTVFIIVLQQFDGNILGPKILGETTGLPAMWVLVAIIVGGGLFGFAGMILGVPTAAVLYVLASEFISRRLKKKGYDEATVGSPGGLGRSVNALFKMRKEGSNSKPDDVSNISDDVDTPDNTEKDFPSDPPL